MHDGRSVIVLGNRRAAWRWTRGYVENLASAIALAATDDRAAKRIYNIGEERALSEAQWVECIGRAAGWKGSVLFVPEDDLPDHLKTPFDWRHDLVGDTSKLRRELGYTEPIGIEEAMERTVAWEREHPPARYDSKLFDYAAEDVVLDRLSAP
jgi:nucleoside-diphosphate-sugar epimerase